MKSRILIFLVTILFFINCQKKRNNPLDPKADLPVTIRYIKDYDFIKKKYYLLNRGMPVLQGSLSIYLDDNIQKNNFSTIPIPFKNIYKIETNDCDLLYSGADYIIDYEKGFVEFKMFISGNYDIIVSYRRDRFDYPDFYTDPYIDKAYTNKMIVNGKTYTFLHRKSTVSPYEYKGVYYIGDKNIDKDNKYFELYILDRSYRKFYNQPFTERDSLSFTHSGSSYASYYIDSENGFIIFDTSRPFEFPGSYYLKPENQDKSIYEYNPNRNDSYYNLQIKYRK